MDDTNGVAEAGPGDSAPVGSERDPEFIRRNQRVLELYASYFRPDVRGFVNLPATGPFLVVGNHSGGATPPDLPIMMTAWWRQRGVEEPVYALFHSFFLGLPGVGPVVAKAGAIEATAGNAEAVLSRGGILIVYPGGDHEAYRPWNKRNTIDFAGRSGFIRQALQNRVPIVPVVSEGAQDTMFVLYRGEKLAQSLPYMRNWRLKVYPILIGAPWGLSVGLPTIPFPARVTVQLCPPIDLSAEYGPEAAEDDAVVAECYERVTSTMQGVLDDLVDERRQRGVRSRLPRIPFL
jgi:1-acyl-sn-glycerol-3-phosphate acyltransferase